MSQPPPEYTIAFQTRHRRSCSEIQLVLGAAGIGWKVSKQGGVWLIAVHHDDLATAKAEIEAYQTEKSDERTHAAAPRPRYRGAIAAVVVYTSLLLAIAAIDASWGVGANLGPAGQIEARLVKSGQLWRTVTALTLHADAGHLSANIVFGSLFGMMAGRVYGGGLAWLAILMAGAAGNLINSLLQHDPHRSIGASTAVFGALGILVAHAIKPDQPRPESLMKRWSPLIGGLVLLAFTGIGGPRTDTGAHFAGFVAGLLMGWIAGQTSHTLRASSKLQWIAGSGALMVVLIAWLVALIAAISEN